MKTTKRTVALYSTAALLLSVPFFAMFFTEEVNWTFFDFVVAGTLLFGTATIIELICRKPLSANWRFVLVVGTLLALFLIWAELAVGIFGSPMAGS